MIENLRRQNSRRISLVTGMILVIGIGNIINFSTALESKYSNSDYFTTNAENEYLEFSTYFGSSGDEMGISAGLHYVADTVVDSQGNIIIVGRSAADDFPIVSAYQDTRGGSIDATVSKFSPNGTLLFSTYLGGFDDDWANCVTLDSSNNIIIGGVTGSDNFPLKNPYQDTCLGGTESNADCFITKLSSDGQSLLYSSYFGGTNSDWCYAIATDSSNRIAFTGTTFSGNLPMVNANMSNIRGNLDAYVVVLAANGQSVVMSSYLGSSYSDAGRGIAFDSHGDVLVSGHISVCSLGTPDAFQQVHAGGGADAYLAKFDLDGTLEYLTYFGGNAYDRANDLVIDSEDNVIITGYTQSTNLHTLNAFQNFTQGSFESFVAKFTNDGTSLIFSSYFGGTNQDIGYGVTVDAADNVLVTGETVSSDFPTYCNFSSPRGKSDVYLGKFKKDGDLLFSVALGGSELDLGAELVSCDANSIAIVGFTLSYNFPTKNAYQETYGGACDLFLLRIETTDMDIEPIVPITETLTPTTEEASYRLLSLLFLIIPVTTFVNKRRKETGSF